MLCGTGRTNAEVKSETTYGKLEAPGCTDWKQTPVAFQRYKTLAVHPERNSWVSRVRAEKWEAQVICLCTGNFATVMKTVKVPRSCFKPPSQIEKIPVAILASDWVGTELQPVSKVLSTHLEKHRAVSRHLTAPHISFRPGIMTSHS